MGDKLLLKLNNYEKPIANKYYEAFSAFTFDNSLRSLILVSLSSS